MKNAALFLMVEGIVLVSNVGGAKAFEVFPICTNPAEQVFPAVSGSTIIWSDNRNGKWEIYGFYLATQTEFSIPTDHSAMPGHTNDRAIAIDGDIVVWMDDRPGGRGIYGYDLSSGREFLLSSGDKHFPEIEGDVVVWENVWSVSGYNLSTSERFDIGHGAVPAVSDGVVVFHVWDNQRDIVGYDLSTDTRFSIYEGIGNQCNPDISGDIVVWRDDRDGSFSMWDIWGYDLLTDRRFLIKKDAGGIENYPIIDGDIVVWDGGGYDLSTRSELAIPIGLHPYVSGDVIVWEQSGDLYGVIIPEPATMLLLGLGAIAVKKGKARIS